MDYSSSRRSFARRLRSATHDFLSGTASASGEPVGVKETAAYLGLAEGEIVNVEVALSTRTIIARATGILMIERNLTAESAFACLVEVSSHTNMKLRETAARIVAKADERARAAAREQ